MTSHPDSVRVTVGRPRTRQRKLSVLAKNLCRLRQLAGLTQEQLARKAGVGVASVVRAETGDVDPHQKTAEAIAGALGVTLSELQADTVTRPVIEPAIQSFIRSPWAAVLKPPLTEQDLVELRQLTGGHWLNLAVNDEALYHLVCANRAVRTVSASTK